MSKWFQGQLVDTRLHVGCYSMPANAFCMCIGSLPSQIVKPCNKRRLVQARLGLLHMYAALVGTHELVNVLPSHMLRCIGLHKCFASFAFVWQASMRFACLAANNLL